MPVTLRDLTPELIERFASRARQASGWGRGKPGPTLKELAKEFDMSIKTAQRLRVRLGLQAKMPQRKSCESITQM